MAAFGALLALALPRDRVAAGLASFSSSASQNPLRLNFYRSRGVTLMVDYAHNAAAYEAIIATGRQLTQGRLIGVVAAPCDRRAADLVAIGKLCGAGFDGLVIYEMDDLRRQPAGETAELIAAGALAAQHTRKPAADRCQWTHTVLDIRAAIRHACGQAEPGDLIVIGCASHVSELREALGGIDFAAVDAATLSESVAEQSAREFKTLLALPSDGYARA